MKKLAVVAFLLSFVLLTASSRAAESVFVEAESFQEKGGWVVDQQFMDIKAPGQAGSVILLAHGLGKPVANAKTTVTLPAPGEYRIFARTRNWVLPWAPAGLTDEALQRDWAPGKFRLILNGKPSAVTLGIYGSGWGWQKAGYVTVTENNLQVAVELQDLTGFDGRLDALYFTTDPAEKCSLPDDPQPLDALRPLVREENPKEYDLVVVGGGIPGTCAACSAAHLGLKVALIQDRPVLGGNGSTEVRVHLNGGVNLPPYRNVGNMTYLMGPHGGGAAREASFYKDDDRLAVCQKYPNLDLFLSTHVTVVEKQGNAISAVIGKNIESGVETRFKGKLFADCTGDGCVGYLAGADWRMGRECKSDFNEPSALDKPDKMTMGASSMWYTVVTDRQTSFPELPWAHQFSKESVKPALNGNWDWETGMNHDQIWEFEHIRDNALRAAYGHWSYMKNHAEGKWTDAVKNRELGWLAYICGKRESRRLLGDIVLREQDITSNRQWEDACVPCTWAIDLHYPTQHNTKYFAGDEFRTYFVPGKKPPRYAIPYRTLYSRNVDNLFMAGRDISVTHIALGTVRVMRTGGMMGEVVGMAAAVCRKNDCNPRAVYTDHLPELIALMTAGVGDFPQYANVIQTPKWLPTAGVNYARTAKVTASSEHFSGSYPVTKINDGIADVSNNDSRWVSQLVRGTDRVQPWVEFSWDKPVTINACRIVSGYIADASPLPGDPAESFQLQTFRNGVWVDIPNAGVKDNKTLCDLGVQFDAVTTTRLRLLINSADGTARVWELELYNVGK